MALVSKGTKVVPDGDHITPDCRIAIPPGTPGQAGEVQPVQSYPGAASATLAPVLAGPPRPVSVVAATPAAVYLRTGHPGSPALCLAAPGAVRVPCALLVGSAPLHAGAPPTS